MHPCVETQTHALPLKGQTLVKKAEEAVIIIQCMLSRRNSAGAGIGNNKLSSQGGTGRRYAMLEALLLLLLIHECVSVV